MSLVNVRREIQSNVILNLASEYITTVNEHKI